MRNFPSMITNAFSHRSFMHFALNMYVLKGFMHPWTSKEKNTTLPVCLACNSDKVPLIKNYTIITER